MCHSTIAHKVVAGRLLSGHRPVCYTNGNHVKSGKPTLSHTLNLNTEWWIDFLKLIELAWPDEMIDISFRIA